MSEAQDRRPLRVPLPHRRSQRKWQELGSLECRAGGRLYRLPRAQDRTPRKRCTLRKSLAESAALYQALRLPLLSSEAGPVLRQCDRRELLGSHLLIVGTNAIAAYMVEANGFVILHDETEDCDLAWVAEYPDRSGRAVWDMLKAADPTFTVNSERDFQARNAKAHEVELLVAPSRAGSLAGADQPRPMSLPEQEWLLLGRPVDQVVGCHDGSPARIVAPDPR